MLRRNFISGLSTSLLGFLGVKPVKVDAQEFVVHHGDIKYVVVGDQVVRIEAKDATRWYKDGSLHREDGPAVEYAIRGMGSGTKIWYQNGNLHREDGPAMEFASGDKQWFLNGKRHRTDGPAIERANGWKEWYLDGKLIEV